MRQLALIVALLVPELCAAASGKVRIAVLEIRALGTAKEKADLLSEVVLSELSSIPGLEVVGSSDIQSMLGFEKQKQLLGCSEGKCIAEIGGALGVGHVLVGTLGKIGNLLRIDLKLIDTGKNRVVARVGQGVEGREELIVAAVQKATRDLLEKSGVLKALAKAEPPKAAPAPSPAAPAVAAAPAPAPAAIEPAPSPAPAPAAAVSATSEPSESKGGRTGAWVALGGGVAALAAGGVFGVLARSAYSDEQAAASKGDPAAYDTAYTAVKTRSRIADACFGVGAIAAGVGLYLALSGPPSEAGLALGVHGGPSLVGMSLSGGF